MYKRQTDIPDGHQSREPERGCARYALLASRITYGRHAKECDPRDEPDDRTGRTARRVREHRASRCQEFCDIGSPRE
jgi:hypothetical protein